MSELAGKRVFVTGSARGIGLAIAQKAIALGATAVLSDVDEKEAAAAARRVGAAGVANADVTNEEQVFGAVESAVGILGGLDVMVNNAGIEISVPLLQQSTESFEKIFAVNVTGVFLGMKASIGHLVESGGNIVNISSIAGTGGSPLLGSYCATKAAVVQLTRVAAVEMRPSGVRVNAVCPGFADTSMVDRLRPDFEDATQVPFGDLVAAKQGRLGTPEDIAEVTCFLASDRASWTTGSHYILDGGLTASLV
jgi:NAD(P)-dependent dehydrogenase (short-subunit alcohol dehydrogenase family)